MSGKYFYSYSVSTNVSGTGEHSESGAEVLGKWETKYSRFGDQEAIFAWF